MTLNLAETSVVKSRPSVPYRANSFRDVVTLFSVHCKAVTFFSVHVGEELSAVSPEATWLQTSHYVSDSVSRGFMNTKPLMHRIRAGRPRKEQFSGHERNCEKRVGPRTLSGSEYGMACQAW